MNDLKPIKSNCLCVITRGETAGKEVKTGNYEECLDGRFAWRVFAPWVELEFTYYTTPWLMRIDGDEELKKEFQEELDKEKELESVQ